MIMKVFVCIFIGFFFLLNLFISTSYIKDQLRMKIFEKIPIPPHQQHFLNWVTRSFDDQVGIFF